MKKINLIKYILIGIVIIYQFILLRNFFSCWDFKSDFHFSSYGLRLKIEGEINNDVGIPFIIVRFFHNKINFFILDIFKRWIFFWDLPFLLSHLSIIGVFGLLAGAWYLFEAVIKKEIKSDLFLFIYIVFFPFLEIIFSPKLPFLIKICLMLIPRQLFALSGLWKFLTRNKKGVLIVIGLIFISIFGQRFFINEFKNFCAE